MSEPKEVVVNDDVQVVEEESYTPEVHEGQEGIKVSLEKT